MKEMNIGKKISEKRRGKGITQEELALYMGVSKASVSKWETGQSYPDITFLPELATYFNISVDDLIGYAPQMTQVDIGALYQHFTEAFTEKPFEEVILECHLIIKKYYSCFPLLFKMSVLLLNHYVLGETKERQNEILEEIIEISLRIKSESDDLWLGQQANSILVTCFIAMERPLEALEHLDEKIQPKLNDEVLLASIYLMLGHREKANKVLEIGIYQGLQMVLGCGITLLSVISDKENKFEELVEKMQGCIDLFDIQDLNANTALVIYFSIAQGYAQRNNKKKALEFLEKYKNSCLEFRFPYTLHGNHFFNTIDSWFKEIGGETPRDEKLIKKSMFESVLENPFFAFLEKEDEFKKIMTQMRSKLEIES